MSIEKPTNPENRDVNHERASEALEVHKEAQGDLSHSLENIKKTWDRTQETFQDIEQLRQKGERVRRELIDKGEWTEADRDVYEAMQQYIADAKEEAAEKVNLAEEAFLEMAEKTNEIRREIKKRLPKS